MNTKEMRVGPLEKRDKPAAIALFCGCGGLSHGFAMVGYNIVLGIDNDSTSLETFRKNHPEAKSVLGDLTELQSDDIVRHIGSRSIDVVIGGPPCQGMSLAGPRKFDDPRNRLFRSFARITEDLQPNAFVLENVPGLLGLYKGEIKNAILQEFGQIGYSIKFRILNAADYGVPQIRDRVFFVGFRKKETGFVFPEPTHFAEGSVFLNKPKYITCENALSDLPPLEDEIGEEMQSYPVGPLNEYQEYARKDSKFVFNHIGTRHSDKVRKIISLVTEGGNYKELPDHLKDTRKFNIAWTRYHSKKPAPTIDTGHRHHFHYKYNRIPTVRESARLQSFPDSFIFCGSKTEQYRQVGNAVPPLLAAALGRQLLKHI